MCAACMGHCSCSPFYLTTALAHTVLSASFSRCVLALDDAVDGGLDDECSASIVASAPSAAATALCEALFVELLATTTDAFPSVGVDLSAALVVALRCGTPTALACVKHLLGANASLSVSSEAVRWAVVNKHIHVAELLICDARVEFDADVFFWGVRAAVWHSSPRILHALLQTPAFDPSAENNYALRQAAWYGATESVAALLRDPRVDPTAEEHEALRMACNGGHFDVVALLLPRSAPQARHSEGLRAAASRGHSNIVALLLRDGRASPDAFDDETLRMAAAVGDSASVQALLSDPRVSPRARDSEALQNAAAGGHRDVVALLLNDGRCDLAARNGAALRLAVVAGRTSVVELLLPSGARCAQALTLAVQHGHDRIVQALLAEEWVDPAALDNEAVRAVQSAATLRLLLADGRCDPSANEQELICTARDPQMLLELLRDPRVDAAARDNIPIRNLMRYGGIDGIKLLLADKRVDPHSSNALSLAAQFNSAAVVELLLRAGCDQRLDESLQVAVINDRVDNVRLLLADKRVDPSADHNRAVRCARSADVVELLLRDERVDPCVDENALLRRALQDADIELVRLLLADRRVHVANVAFPLPGSPRSSLDRGGWLALFDVLLRDGRIDPRANSGAIMRQAVRYSQHGVINRLLLDARIDPQTLGVQLDRIAQIRARAADVCIGLEDLALPAFVTLKILNALFFGNTVNRAKKWELITKVKHCKRKP
jgi:ankyrin repeat protein